jgi:acetolactate synthase-1/2/3 large subunit
MKRRESGAQFIAQTITGYGITHVFYVEAILRRTLVEMEKLGIRRVLVHSEKAAAYMADGYARAGNRPGLCMAQSVGAANLAAGLQDAFLGHSPVVAFTGRKPPLYQYRNSYQEILHNSMYQAVTKCNLEVDTLDQLSLLLPQAFREAASGCPGPVHLDFLGYEGNLTDEAEGDLEVVTEPQYARLPPWRPAAETEDIQRAAQALREASHPVLVVGRGALISGARGEVQELAERLSIPVAISIDGKGVLPECHPLHVGPLGGYCAPCSNAVVAEADLVFFIGTSAGDLVTKNWTLPPAGSRVIQLDISPVEIGRNYPGSIGLLGDVKASLTLLNEELRGPGEMRNAERVTAATSADDGSNWARHVGQVVQAWRSSVEPMRKSDAVPIRPERLCAEITAVLPDDAVVVADTGYSAIWAGTLIEINKPGQSFFRAAGSLGWAFPAAIGAKCALPDRPVICFTGDGAFWYHLSEVETAVRWNIPTITVINNNSVLGQSQLGIRRAYGNDSGHMEDQYRFRDTDFAQLARGLGAFGIRVEKPREIKEALREALAAGRPAVVDVVTEPESHPVM